MMRPKILIADNNAINRGMLRVIFEDGYELFEAADGQEVLDLFNQGYRFSLLLLDLNMPKANGLEVLEYLQEQNLLSTLPVIIVTGSLEEEDEMQALNRGAADIVRKPFAPEVLLRRAQNLIELYDSRKNLENQLISAQRYDPLTGLLNRRTFFQAAENTLASVSLQERKNYAFIYTNIHNFKLYNVEFGVDSGDTVLKFLAEDLNTKVNCVHCARLGQDHLVVLTKQSDEEILQDALTINRIFYEKYSHYGMSFKIGCYRIQTGEETVYAACELAKLACDSIRTTSESFRQYDEMLGQQIERSAYVLQHIDEAIEKEYIQVYFQPVVRTLSGKLCGMEALARWIDPKIGFLSPADFIPTLEEDRLIAKLDLYVLKKVCRFIKQRLQENEPVVPVSFNLSRVDFEEGDIFREVERIVTEEGVPRRMVNVEITESALMYHGGIVRREVERFREGGYQVWMDDFGSGYSSLNVLKDCQFDEIKLDMRFLSSFDEKSKRIVRSVIDMAKGIGVQTLAEGVETQEQYDFLRNIGCEKVQGYFISKPLPCSKIQTSFLADQNEVEDKAYRRYFDTVGKVNLLTDKPLALIEWDGIHFTYLFANAEYAAEMISTGVKDLEEAGENMNRRNSSLNEMFVSFCKKCRQGDGEQELIYSVRGCVIRVIASCVAECGQRKVIETRVLNLSEVRDENLRIMSRLDASHKITGGYELLWNSLAKSNLISMFWKDTDRRFVGVNAKFLQTYGFADMTAVIGKTDEEMGWHPDDKPFHDDEERVLKYGESMINRAGKCIIRGEVHNILASKEPIYQDGEIVGLIGIFIDLDGLEQYVKETIA